MKKRCIFFSLLIGLILSGCEAKGEQLEDNPTNTPMVTTVPTATNSPIPTEAPVELVVYSQLSSFWGEQQGWFAKIMLDKFNVKLQILPDIYEEDGELEKADIIVFGGVGSGVDNLYRAAAEKGLLLDWEANNLLDEHGAYIQEHMAKALEYNRSLTPDIGKVFGFGQGVAPSADSIEDFFYTWDIRWDLYKQLGYPEVKDLDDLVAVLEQMKALCPRDEKGEEVYAVSLWKEWDDTMVMNVRTMASAYYGYHELGMGLYDSETGAFHDALEEKGPYLAMLKFFNTLYRKGLLDPDSATQTYDDMIVKLQNGGVLFSVLNYAGSLTYNTEENLVKNKFMASLLPEEATPVTYGMSVYGGGRIWTISADTEYPALCMKILNWLCTPEGKMVSTYGPQGVIWDYDEAGNTFFTEFGKICMKEGYTDMPGEYAGATYWDGFPQINNITWATNAENPDSNGETYNQFHWKSNIPAASCEIEQDWRSYTGALTTFDYLKSKKHVVVPATFYAETEKSKELETCWEQVASCIVEHSWNAVYADSEETFDVIVADMIAEAEALGYKECYAWCKMEAVKRFALEQAARE